MNEKQHETDIEEDDYSGGDIEADPGVIGAETDGVTVREITTRSGQVYDLNNMPGIKKIDLIESGELAPSQTLSLPANMPGKLLQPIREKRAAALEKSLEKSRAKKNKPAKTEGNTQLESPMFEAGATVEYRGEAVQIIEVLQDEGKYIIEKPDEKRVKILYASVKDINED